MLTVRRPVGCDVNMEDAQLIWMVVDMIRALVRVGASREAFM